MMQNQYYTIPISANDLIKDKDVRKCNINDSIANYLHLLLESHFGECHFDKHFGCAIWNVDFNNVANDSKLMTMIRQSLYESIEKYERRLSKVDINVTVHQEEQSKKGGISKIKKQVSISLKGVIKKTNEEFKYNEDFFIGPLSY